MVVTRNEKKVGGEEEREGGGWVGGLSSGFKNNNVSEGFGCFVGEFQSTKKPFKIAAF